MLSLKTSTAMELLPVVCLCLLTRCGITSADGNEPVVVTVKEDEDALLPCFRSTENIEQGHFDWNKVAQNNEIKKEVFRYNNFRHSNSTNPYGAQDGGFKDRVSHFQEELKRGNASIIIRKTKMADNGDYTCTFTEPLQTFHIKLVVGTCPKPNLKTLGPTKGGMLLQCEVRGAFPKPKVELKDSSGQTLSAEELVVLPGGGGGLYDITLQATVIKSDNYICVSTQEEICHQIFDDDYVSVNGNDGSGANSSDPPTGLIVGIVVLAVIVVILAAVVFKRHIPLNCNKDSQTARKDGSEDALNGQSSQSA